MSFISFKDLSKLLKTYRGWYEHIRSIKDKTKIICLYNIEVSKV